MWFILQRAIAILLSFAVADRFPNCGSAADVWHTFRAMPTVEQIGILAVILVVLYVLVETLDYTVRHLLPILGEAWTRLNSWMKQLSSWLEARRKAPPTPPAE